MNLEKQDVLFFMHWHGGNIGYYEPHMINQFSDNYLKIVLSVNLKHIANIFLKLGANIQSTELNMGREFPKLSRDVINEWMAQNN